MWRKLNTLRQALEKMEHHGYAAVPLLSTEGKYLGTLTWTGMCSGG